MAPTAFAQTLNLDAGPQAGRATRYDATTTVACAIPSSLWPAHVAALSEPQFQAGLACGATAHLTYTKGGTVKEMDVMIVDLCPTAQNAQWCSGDTTHFDLMDPAFSTFDLVSVGVLHTMQFQWTPTPVTGPVKLRWKDGINAWWVAVQVLNHRYPIKSVEIKDPVSGNWLMGDRTLTGNPNWFKFAFTGNGLTPSVSNPAQIRITDQYNHQILESATQLTASQQWDGVNQFPLRPQDGATPTHLGKSKVEGLSLLDGMVYVSASQAPVRIEVFDHQGHTLLNHTMAQAGSWVIPRLEPGVHVLRISKDDNGNSGRPLMAATLAR